MTLKFCANFGFLFLNKPHIDRYDAAGLAGFHGVEGPFPTGHTISEVVNATKAAGVKQVMLNIAIDDVVPNGQFGIASFPHREKEFQANFDKTLALAKALECGKIHIMSGKHSMPPTAENHAAFITNLRYVAKKLENENIIALIEPINNFSVPGYYLNTYQKAIEVIDTIKSSKIRLMLDLFHLQMIQGNIVNSIKEFSDYIGHVQIAQAPDRHEPDTAGEVNLQYVLLRLIQSGYKDWVGCEYIPTDGIGVKWIKDFGYEL